MKKIKSLLFIGSIMVGSLAYIITAQAKSREVNILGVSSTVVESIKNEVKESRIRSTGFKEDKVEVKAKSSLISLGKFKITVYDSCVECSGEWGTQLARPCDGSHKAVENHTIAVDPTVIPYGTKVIIDGVEYTAEDCGGAVKGKVIDVYVNDCKNSFGRKYSEVFIKE